MRYGELTDDVHQRQVMESFQRLYEQLGTYRSASSAERSVADP